MIEIKKLQRKGVEMMQNKESALLKILARQPAAVSAAILAKQLGLSKNTVRTIIKELNDNSSIPIIESTRSGYKLLTSGVVKINEGLPEMPQTYLGRAFYIIKKIIIMKKEVNIYDLAEELFISYSTLKNTIAKMNTTFERFETRFVCKKNMISILGREENLRRLASYAVAEETNWQFADLEPIKKTFGSENVESMQKIIRETFMKYQAYLNDFAFMTLLLHFLILIERVQHGRMLEVADIVEDSGESELFEELISHTCKEIQETFQLILLEGDCREIAHLVLSTGTVLDSSLPKKRSNKADEKILQEITKIAEEINEVYRINLVDQFFLTRFSLHIRGLLERSQKKRYNRNPLLESIKRECRAIFDIAVIFSLKLEKVFTVNIIEDEIAYIALHIASELDRQKTNEEKTHAVLFSPNYDFYSRGLKNQLESLLGDDFYIKAELSRLDQLDDFSFDLILSTVELIDYKNKPIIQLPAFLNQENKNLVLQRILDFQRGQKRELILTNFSSYFSEDLFYLDPDFNNKNQLIDQLCKTMYQQGIVPENFNEKVLERENAASTAFSAIAIPHSIQMDAFKTKIAIVISNEGILWDTEKIHIILLFAINYVDRSNFSQIYESLISIFEGPTVLKELPKLCQLQDVKTFIEASII